MMMSTDPANFRSQQTNRKAARNGSILALTGTALVALGIGLGVWWGITTADGQALQLPLPAGTTSTSSDVSATSAAPSMEQRVGNASVPSEPIFKNSVGTAASMGQGEVIVNQPRFSRPPQVFDPLEALAAQASLVAATPTVAQQPFSQASKSVGQAVTAVVPTGWQGSGSALLQMWDLGAQSDWAVRPAPLSPRNWRISGVVQRGEQTQAIVQFDGDPAPRFFKIGETLPGGAKLAWVKPNVIGVVMPKAGVLAVPVLDGQEPPPSQSKKP